MQLKQFTTAKMFLEIFEANLLTKLFEKQAKNNIQGDQEVTEHFLFNINEKVRHIIILWYNERISKVLFSLQVAAIDFIGHL